MPHAYLVGPELALGSLQTPLQGGHSVQRCPAFPLTAPHTFFLQSQLCLGPTQTPVHTAPGCSPKQKCQTSTRPWDN